MITIKLLTSYEQSFVGTRRGVEPRTHIGNSENLLRERLHCILKFLQTYNATCILLLCQFFNFNFE
jgi:hypothetical protein